jgi:hypothetical protein
MQLKEILILCGFVIMIPYGDSEMVPWSAREKPFVR